MKLRYQILSLLLSLSFATGCATAPTAATPPSAPAATAAGAKQYIYVLRPARAELVTTGPTERELPHLRGHVAYMQQLTQDGKLLLAGRSQNNDADTFGIAIFVASSDEEAAAIMNNDPAVKNGVMTAKVYPYEIAFGRFAAK